MSKDTGPKPALTEIYNTSELLKIAECAAGLFKRNKVENRTKSKLGSKKYTRKLNKSLH